MTFRSARTGNGVPVNSLRPITSRVSYWFQRGLLVVLGPAQLDSEHDPVAELDRRFGRRDAS